MVKHTQIIRRYQPTNCLSVFDHFVLLALKGLNAYGPLLWISEVVSFVIKYVSKIFRKTNISYPLISCVSGSKNVSFSENVAYLLNGRSLKITDQKIPKKNEFFIFA